MNLKKFEKKYPEIYEERYNDLQITIKIYWNLTDEQSQELFSKILNNTNVMNSQIIRAANSSVLADIIRALVRLNDNPTHYNGKEMLIGSFTVKRLKMFSYTTKPDDKKEYNYVDFGNGALVQEEAVASMFGYFCKQQYSSGVLNTLYSHKDYDNDFPGFKVWRKVIEGYDKVVSSRKRIDKERLTKWTLINLFNLYYNLIENNYKITNRNKFMKEILTVWYNETQKKSEDGSKGKFALDQNKTSKDGIQRTLKTLHKAIMQNMKKFGVVRLDKRRKFAKYDIEQSARNQNYKCPSCNDKIHREDIVGGHIIMHTYGGNTDLDNAIAIHNDCNKRDHFKDAA